MNRLHQESASNRQPETDKQGNGEVERQIGRHRLYRLAGIVHHRNVGALDAGGQTRFLRLLHHTHVEFVVGVGFLAHGGVLGGRFIGLHAFGGQFGEILADQLLAVDRSLPGAAELLDQA